MDAKDFYDKTRGVVSFTVTEDHLKLLRSAYVGWQWCEFGAPEIDPKRPYGNSDVVGDIAEILDPDGTVYPENEDGERELSDEEDEKLTRLHAETAIALQIVLLTGEFKTGRYTRTVQWRNDWVRADG